jgi:precorrin-6A/cobalt-precorrin-6A reductase
VTKKILILGGTAEAAELARRAIAQFAGRAAIITSLAGRTKTPTALPGVVRVGGFGGAQGLADYLETEAIDLLVDATHPFAATISAHAAAACAQADVPRVALVRPPWRPRRDGRLSEVADLEEAAAALIGAAKRVFLTTGRQGLAAFARVPDVWFLVRLIEAPDAPPPLPHHRVVIMRPPFAIEAERALMREHRIDTVVAKNSGGAATAAKIEAALDEGIRVVLVRRPPPQAGDTAATVDQVMTWLGARL